jgi:hypothetical protein
MHIGSKLIGKTHKSPSVLYFFLGLSIGMSFITTKTVPSTWIIVSGSQY